MKIVVISRAIFPFIAPRPFRATELAKEFARQGHEVILYGVLGDYDYSNFEREHNLKVKNLGPVFFSKLNSDGKNKRSLINRISEKILKRIIEYPDIELAFKVNKALRKEDKIDLLITIAVPYPIHWGAAMNKTLFKKDFSTCWVADCGDPYMGNPFHKRPFYFKYIEKWFCKNADYLSVPIDDAKDAYYQEFRNKIKVIPQGFNFDFNEDKMKVNNKILTFIYAGNFYENGRNPKSFLEYLMKQEIDFKFIVYTRSYSFLKEFEDQLKGKLIIKDFIPREELLSKMEGADFLINIENAFSVQSPSKLIDYAIAGRPILTINTENLNTKIIDEFLNRNYLNQLKINDIEQYHITNVSKKFLQLCGKY